MQKTSPVGSRPARSIYGSIVVMALLISTEGQDTSALEVILLIVATMFTLGIVEFYANFMGARIERRRHLQKTEVLHFVWDAIYTAGAALVPLLFFALAAFHVIRLEAAFLFSRVFMIATLFGYGVLFGRMLKRNLIVCILIGLGQVLFGTFLIALQAAFH